MNQRSTISSFKVALRSVGFDSRLIADGYSFTDFKERCAVVQTVPLAAFSTYPCTYRNACVGIVFSDERQHGAEWVYRHRALGAPLIFEVGEKSIQPWSIGPTEPRAVERPFSLDTLESMFRSHRAIWNPDALGRLKSASDAKPNRQRDFYDTGLLPVLERFFQAKLKDLLERAFADTEDCFQSVHGKEPAVAFLFPYLFRFVTAKIFMDRADAQGWDGLNTPRQILDKAEKHSGSGLLEQTRFHIDHLISKKERPDLICDYENLILLEGWLNLVKGKRRLPDPCKVALGKHLVVCTSGEQTGCIEARGGSEIGDWIIRVLRLDSEDATEIRRNWIGIFRSVARTDEQLFRKFISYPKNLPNLREARVRNSRESGLRQSAKQLLDDGNLPDWY